MRQGNEGQNRSQRRQDDWARPLHSRLDDRIKCTQPFLLVLMDLPDEDQGVAHQNARQRDQSN
ncbi:hypothetical protein D3C81_1822890 [compost metagenome]